MKIEILQSEYTTPRENLEKMGYKYEGVEIDRRNKKHTLFSKDGKDFEFKGCDITGENYVITLINYE